MTKLLTDAEAELLYRNIASMIGAGLPHTEVRSRLTLTHHELRKALDHPDTQRYIRELAEETSKTALTALKKGIAGMADLTLKALESNLKKGNMQAVRTALEVMGALAKEQVAPVDTSITVVMPGGTTENVIEVQGSEEG